jgi:UDP-N-acetylglucosamine 1-carboxyvinyltransferase
MSGTIPAGGGPLPPGRQYWAAVDDLVVRRTGQLSGSVRLSGAKNSALKLIPACLLAEGTHRLHEVPRIDDVATMSELVTAMGVEVTRTGGGRTLEVSVPPAVTPVAPYELVERMRASIVVLGPLLARHGWARVSLPGGDDFGERPIDYHVRAFQAMGAEFTTEHGYVEGRCPRLHGARIVLEFPSHTTTDNILMAAVLAEGTTVIENAAREPEIVDLVDMLCSMGARIEGAGTSHIEIEGVDELEPADHTAIPDRVEAATFLVAAAVAGGSFHIERARPEHMDMLLEKLRAMGLQITATEGGLHVENPGRIRAADVVTLPYPGVATDYMPLLVTALSVADGVAIVTENLFRGRFRYVDELRRMAADIRTEGHHIVVRGVPQLSGAPVRATDLRAGASLVLAGLAADGETVVTRADHIDRGYEDYDGKLRSLGADVTRRPAGQREPA